MRPSETLRVKAVEGRLISDPRVPRTQRRFIGWRTCSRNPDGSFAEDGTHTIEPAPGISTDDKGGWASQTSDLFVAGFEVRLSHLDSEGQPIVEEVPNTIFFRTAVRDGDLAEVKDEPAGDAK